LLRFGTDGVRGVALRDITTLAVQLKKKNEKKKKKK